MPNYRRTASHVAAKRASRRPSAGGRPAQLTVRRWRKLLLGTLLLACGLGGPRIGRGEELSRLMRQLESDRFGDRQAAQRELLMRWESLGSQLESIPPTVDPEVRTRLTELRSRALRLRYESLLSGLLAEPLQAASPELPLWNQFVARVGDDLPARRLYHDMLSRETELLTLLDRDDETFPVVLQHRLRELVDIGPFRNFLPEEDVAPASVAVLMLIAMETDGESHALLSDVLRSRISFGLSSQNAAQPAGTQAPLRRLLSAWVESPQAAPRELRLEKGRQYGLPATVGPARETLQSARATVLERKDAVLALARFGDLEFVPVLVPLLSDPAVLDQSGVRGRTTRQTRIQDLALVALLRATGQSPQEYGFEGLQDDEATVYRESSVGFATQEARDAALHRWKRWVLLHHEGLLLGGPDAIGGATL